VKKALAVGLTMAAGAAFLAACDDVNTVHRASAPMVLTGADLPQLLGEAPGDIVAFAHSRPGDTPTWTQIPVQVDERKVVPYGSQPANNTTAGVTGTVYGNGSGGPTALQYADAGTWVGADADATFDADDELVFMVEDAGGLPRVEEATEPPGVVPGSGVQVQLDDPLGDDSQAWVHLFVSSTLDPAAGEDYVDYDFALTSGSYKTTYKRADGPNPETSSVTTDAYRIAYTDRWYETSWRIDAGSATGVDILDGNKNQFALDFCGRSNATFADAEGAFVANIDGPVRGIRSYVGANSGPLTQRTHLMYRTQEVIVTDLRVHSIPAVMDYLDYSDAALGMTYRSSVVPGGVTVDRLPDPSVTTAIPEWEYVTGPQGTVMTKVLFETDIATPGGFQNAVDWLYRDEASPSDEQCWGDAHHTGVHGSWVVETIPDTDPRSASFKFLESTRIAYFADPSMTNDIAAAWSEQVETPLVATVAAYTP
jgi:hypothetical protein